MSPRHPSSIDMSAVSQDAAAKDRSVTDLLDPSDRMCERRQLAEGIAPSGLLLCGEDVAEVRTGILLPPVVGEKANPVPGHRCRASDAKGRLDLGWLVGADRVDAQAIAIGSSIECFEGLAPEPGHTGSHRDARSVACQKRNDPSGTGGCDERTNRVVERRKVHRDAVAAHQVVVALLVSEGEDITELERESLPDRLGLARSGVARPRQD